MSSQTPNTNIDLSSHTGSVLDGYGHHGPGSGMGFRRLPRRRVASVPPFIMDDLNVAVPAHTPGPWDISNTALTEGEFWIYADGEYIASVDARAEEAEANAYLIAAAPELVNACLAAYHQERCLCEELERPEPGDCLSCVLSKAIAEAEGR